MPEVQDFESVLTKNDRAKERQKYDWIRHAFLMAEHVSCDEE